MKTTADLTAYAVFAIFLVATLVLIIAVWKRGKKVTIQLPFGIKVVVELEPSASKK